jgi:hypothetical protein
MATATAIDIEKQLLVALDELTQGVVLTRGLPAEFRTESYTQEAAETQERHQPWVEGTHVQGLGVAERTTDTKMLEEIALKVYVDEKKPLSQIEKSQRVPREIKIAGFSKPLPTDVEAIGTVKLESNTTRVRPAVPGFSIGHSNITAGTFGCLVRKKGDSHALYILSNSHVLADSGLASKGDKILQPGKLDGGTAPADVIGTLEEFIPLIFGAQGYPNLVDAAIAKVRRAPDVTSAIRLIGVPKGISTALRRGMQIQKTGRTSDHTIGVVRDINHRTFLPYKKPGGGTGRVGFTDQVLCSRYTDGGDSGSAVLTMQGNVVGLHFAGSASSSIFNKIGNVLNALDIEIVTKLV